MMNPLLCLLSLSLTDSLSFYYGILAVPVQPFFGFFCPCLSSRLTDKYRGTFMVVLFRTEGNHLSNSLRNIVPCKAWKRPQANSPVGKKNLSLTVTTGELKKAVSAYCVVLCN